MRTSPRARGSRTLVLKFGQVPDRGAVEPSPSNLDKSQNAGQSNPRPQIWTSPRPRGSRDQSAGQPNPCPQIWTSPRTRGSRDQSEGQSSHPSNLDKSQNAGQLRSERGAAEPSPSNLDKSQNAGQSRSERGAVEPSLKFGQVPERGACLLYTSPSPRDLSTSRMPSSA